MKKIFRQVFLLTAVCCMGVGCGDTGDEGLEPGGGPITDPNVFSITAFENLNRGTAVVNSHAASDVLARSSLKLNYRSYISMGTTELGSAVTTPHYPRIRKMRNGNYMLVVNQNQHGGSCYYTVSSNLKLWEPRGKVFSSEGITDLTYGNSNTRMFATTDLVVLANGDILAAASYRANTGGYTTMPKDAGVMLRRSTNNGTSWSEPVQIYQGVNWEPYLLQLSSGEIHCYFTDSSRTGAVAKDTGTVMVVSKDNGNTWTPSFGSAPYYVIRSSYQTTYKDAPITCYNDQMPSVIQLNETGELAAAMETARPVSDYDISFAYSGEDGEWTLLNPDQTGPEDRVNKSFQGAAPYLGQFTSGETVLSYSNMRIKMGNAKARNFSSDVYAPLSGFGSGFWGSTHVADGHQIIVTIPNTSAGTIMLARLALNHNIAATSRSVVVDGSGSEWANTDEALFVGEKSQAQATLRCSSGGDNVYFLVEALDRDIQSGDYATIYLAPVTTGNTLTANQTFRIKVSSAGLVSSEVYTGSGWKDSDSGVTVKAKSENKKNDKSGYIAEISIPRSALTVTSGALLVNFALYNIDEGTAGSEDSIAATSSTNTSKWIKLTGL